jgi:hypothetical protein
MGMARQNRWQPESRGAAPAEEQEWGAGTDETSVHCSIQSKPLAIEILFVSKLFNMIIIVQECRFSFNSALQILLVFTQHNLRLFTGTLSNNLS